jgi:hypothetical protein
MFRNRTVYIQSFSMQTEQAEQLDEAAWKNADINGLAFSKTVNCE